MSTAANDLLQAIQARLGQDADLLALIGHDGFRDRLVTGRRLPAVIVGDLVTSDYSTATEAGEEHVLTLEAWSDAAGQRVVQQVAGALRRLLHDAALPLAGHALVNLQHLSTKARREPKTRLFCAEIRFRAVTE